MNTDSTDGVVQSIAGELWWRIEHILDTGWAPTPQGYMWGEAVGQAMAAYDRYQAVLTKYTEEVSDLEMDLGIAWDELKYR